MKATKIIKLLVIIILAFFFGIFISFSKEPFSKLGLLFIVIFILLIYKAYFLFRKGKKQEFKKYLGFGIVGIISFVLGFTLSITKILEIKVFGPVSSILIFFLLYFITISYILFACRNNLIFFHTINYFVAITSLTMGLLVLYGFINDYISGNLKFPYNIIFPIIFLCLFFLGFITLIMGIKTGRKTKSTRKKRINLLIILITSIILIPLTVPNVFSTDIGEVYLNQNNLYEINASDVQF